MWPRTIFLSVVALLYTSVFAQEKFTTVKNLKGHWMKYEDGAYRALTSIPFTGLRTIYFQLDRSAYPGQLLRIKSDTPYFLLINGKIVDEYRGQLMLDLDSLSEKIHVPAYWIGVHQQSINERDMLTEIISPRPATATEDANAARPYSYFRDFVVIAGLITTLLFLLVFRLHPKLAADYFSVVRIFSSREVDDGQTSIRLTSSSNIQFYVLCSLLIGLYLQIVFYNLPPQYALPVRFQASGFWMIWWQWLKISALVLFVLLMKIAIIFSMTRLFGLRGMARFHFFNWIRLLLVIFGAATILLFIYFISRGDRPDIFAFFLSIVVVTLIAWIVVAFLKLNGRTGHSMFHLFSYLCATEIIPLLITVKVLFQ